MSGMSGKTKVSAKAVPVARQRGGFVMGLVIGLLVGLALALGVALYITKAPIPFVNKVPQRTAEQDTAEAERNRTWDPNAPLGGKPRPAAAGVVAPAPEPASAPGIPPGIAPVPPPVAAAPASAPRANPRDPAAILAGNAPTPTQAPAPAADTFIYFVQAGAFTRSEDAEQQRARLAIIGQTARVTEREQAGRIVYRVRLGPFQQRDEADMLQQRLAEQSIEAQIVRAERP